MGSAEEIGSGKGRLLRNGEIIGERYVIDSVLCVGGMSTVYRATHLLLERPVALKVIASDMIAVPGVVERFMREARAAAKLDNAHIVEVYDVGKLDDGRPYLVMERLEGLDLCDFLAENAAAGVRLSLRETVEYVFQTCEALTEVHARGIVHRDLKPANLFRTTAPDGSPFLKLIDFGISRLLPSGSNVRLTQAGAYMGTPSYMAPEQMGKSEHADARADIWSLGVILFELLTGTVPFEGEGPNEVLFEILMKPRRTVASVRLDVNPAIDEVIAKCLQKSPSERFQSVSELARALAPFGGSMNFAAHVARTSMMDRVAHTSRAKPLRAEITGELPALVQDTIPCPGPPSGDGISLVPVIVAPRENTLPVSLSTRSRRVSFEPTPTSSRKRMGKYLGGPLLIAGVLGVALFCGRTLSVATSPEHGASAHLTAALLEADAVATAVPLPAAAPTQTASEKKLETAFVPPAVASAIARPPPAKARSSMHNSAKITAVHNASAIVDAAATKVAADTVAAIAPPSDDTDPAPVIETPAPKEVARTSLVIDGTPVQNATIRKDDVELAVTSGAPIDIEPGAHLISAVVDGLTVWVAKVNVVDGKTVHLRIPAAYARAYE